MNIQLVNHGFALSTNHTVTAATFTPSTGVMKLTINGHGFQEGDRVKLADGSLRFTCAKDGNASNHDYPRASDFASNRWLPIFNVSTNFFEVNVGNMFGPAPISHTTTHAFVSAVANGLTKANSAVKLVENALTFTCAKDSGASEHSYPRRTDPSFDEWLPLSNVLADSFDVYIGKSSDLSSPTFVSGVNGGLHSQSGVISLNVGISTDTTTHNYVAATKLTPTNAAYNPTTGVMTITVNDHNMANGEQVMIDDGAIKLSCAFGGASGSAAQKDYPRSSDPASGRWLSVSNVSTNTFDVQVLDVVPSTNTDTHSFVSAVSNSITRGILRTGGNHTHTFANARKNAVIAGGIYRHEFVSPGAYTVSDAAYNPTTGVMTLTIPNHGFESGDHIKMDLSLIHI